MPEGYLSPCVLEPEEVRITLESIADAAITKGGPLGKRQQILDDWVKDQNDD